MKILKKMITIVMATTVILMNTVPTKAASASASLTSSSSNVTVGSTVSVTLTVSMSPSFGACIYNITASGNLRLESGDSSYTLEATGSGQTSKSVTLTYKAIAAGTATVSASISQAVTWDDESVSVATQSRNITVSNANSNIGDGGGSNSGTSNEEEKSSNNYLESIVVTDATFTPEFNKETTSYYVSLPEGTTEIEVATTTEDSAASVSGTGKIEVQPGNNTIDIAVTAENGAIRTYSIFATVREVPLFEFEVSGLTYGVVKNIEDLEIPEGFIESTITIDGNEAPCFINEGFSQKLLYLTNEDGLDAFYFYDEENRTLYRYMEITHNNIKFISLPFDEEMLNRAGFVSTELNLQENIIQTLQYDDKKDLSSKLYLIHLADSAGKKYIYVCDSEENTLQRYYDSDSLNLTEYNTLLSKQEKDLEEKQLVIYGLAVASLLFAIGCVYLVLKGRRQKKQFSRMQTQIGGNEDNFANEKFADNVVNNEEIKQEEMNDQKILNEEMKNESNKTSTMVSKSESETLSSLVDEILNEE